VLHIYIYIYETLVA